MKTQELIKRHQEALRILTYMERHVRDSEKKREFVKEKSKTYSEDFKKRIWKSLLERNKSIESLRQEYINLIKN